MRNDVNMVVRNTRPRYPMSSKGLNDQFDEVYWNLSDLLGYQNVSGVIAVSGTILELLGVLTTEVRRCFGTPSSGYTESFVLGSGYTDSAQCSGSMLHSELMGMWYHPW